MSTALAGRHALVTGAGSGIGAAVARRFAAEGAALTLAGRRRAALEAVAGGLERAAVAPADVTDETAVARMLEAAEAAHGPVDVLLACAGAAGSAPLARTSYAEWRATIAVNLDGVFLCARAVFAGMCARGWGRIVLVASTAGLKGYAYVAPYCAAKHGVVGLARALALEGAARGVTVNALCPGFTDTPLLDAAVANIAAKTGASAARARARLAALNPQGRLVRPEEVAAAAAWLCREDSAAVNGEAIAISGGET